MRIIINKKVSIVTLVVVALLSIFIISFYKGDQYALNRLATKSVTPNQLANAMQQDDFYSTYREDILLVNAPVSSVTKHNGATVVGFKTTVAYHLNCKINTTSTDIKSGDTIRILSVAYNAQRQPNGVLLNNCILY